MTAVAIIVSGQAIVVVVIIAAIVVRREECLFILCFLLGHVILSSLSRPLLDG